MHWYIVFLIILIPCDCFVNDTCSNVKTSIDLVRKRRHLTFPKGSNVVLTISLVKAFLTHAPSGWNLALEIDVGYPLPDANVTNRFFRRKLHHRQKRELWERLQNALELQRIDGRSCILRSICEARTHIAPPGKSLVHDILRVIFTAPMHEEDFRKEMKNFDELHDPNFCEHQNNCPFSMLDYIFSFNEKQ